MKTRTTPQVLIHRLSRLIQDRDELNKRIEIIYGLLENRSAIAIKPANKGINETNQIPKTQV
jgi:hypothetical protein